MSVIKDPRAVIDEMITKNVTEKSVGTPLLLFCPECNVQHIDEGIWATKPHRTHQCQSCKHEWKPYAVTTFGVKDLKPTI